MSSFTKITMYRCNYCGKIFKTNILHKCKFDPELKACFSCKHFNSVEEIIGGYFDGEPYTTKYITCSANHIPVNIQRLAEDKWSLHCEKHEIWEPYEGKITYLKHLLPKEMGRENLH